MTFDNYITLQNKSKKLKNIPKIDYVNYWGVGKSTFHQQKYNVNGMRNEKGLTKIEVVWKYVKGKSLLEIGACPGELLKKAVDSGLQATGIIPEIEYLTEMQKTGANIITGFFGEVEVKGKFDTIVAMDIFEHIEDGQKFIDDCKKLLNKDGVIILMLPIIFDDRPFDLRHCNEEHIWLYHIDHLTNWLRPIAIDKWVTGHEVIVLTKSINM